MMEFNCLVCYFLLRCNRPLRPFSAGLRGISVETLASLEMLLVLPGPLALKLPQLLMLAWGEPRGAAVGGLGDTGWKPV